MYCKHCKTTQLTEKHHVIFRSQGGLKVHENEIELCRNCHYQIHHGTNTELKNAILKTCYDYIRPNLDKCWKGIHKSKIVRLIEQGEL